MADERRTGGQRPPQPHRPRPGQPQRPPQLHYPQQGQPRRPQREPSQSQTRRATKRRRTALSRVAGALLYVLLVIAGSAALSTVGWVLACDLLGLNKGSITTEIVIEDDTEFSEVVDTLEKEGLIEYKFLFKLYAAFSHAEDKIAPGTYELNSEMDYHALVSNMGSSSATRQTTDITIKEGLTIDQIFDLLADRGVTSVEKLQDMAANYDYAFDWLEDRPLGDYHRLEGYLFPDTYTFELGENPKYVLNKMLVNFDDKMDEYMPALAAEGAPYSLHDIVIIASMIEKETDSEDYRTISSVIYNRLTNLQAETVGYLQIDATLVYLNGGKVPTLADREIDSPYNTYKYPGLPAGPISNPGMASLTAAMDPDSTGYYFYVLNPETKRHEFSRTYAEHNALVQRYQGNGG
ncbi:MAG: endolytic transglycosylase MltG [Oscillospiraceae bacterium]|nr:endolytic transglycosylase MltG [Oscillospiraceae bacterium]